MRHNSLQLRAAATCEWPQRQPLWSKSIVLRSFVVCTLALPLFACSTEPGSSSDARSVPPIPSLVATDHPAECDRAFGPLSREEFAALPNIWFHGEIVDVYPESEWGSTFFLRNHGYEGELLQDLSTCTSVTPRLLMDVRIAESIGDALPERVTLVIDKSWLASRPVWEDYLTYTWNGADGSGFAPGQRIGGATSVFSQRYQRARLFARPLLPLFALDEEGRIRFQEVRVTEDGFSGCTFPTPSFIADFDGLSPAAFLQEMEELRTSAAAPRGDALRSVREDRLGGSHDSLESDLYSSAFFPTCMPPDYERPNAVPPTSGRPDPPGPSEEAEFGGQSGRER